VVPQLASRFRRSLLQGSRSHASRAFRSRTAFRAGLCCNRREQMSMWPFSAACGERSTSKGIAHRSCSFLLYSRNFLLLK
jgi:hypothetical protein